MTMFFRPTTVIADSALLVGEIVSVGKNFIEGVLAFAVTTVAISVGLLLFPPLIGIPLLFLDVMSVGLLVVRGGRKGA